MEIDFVYSRGDEKIYIQVAYWQSDEATTTHEFGPLEQIADNYPKYVLTMDESGIGNRNGIELMPVRHFLRRLL